MDHRVYKDHRDRKVHKAFRVYRGLKDHRGHRAYRDLKDHRDQVAQQDRVVLAELQERLVLPVLLVLLVL